MSCFFPPSLAQVDESLCWADKVSGHLQNGDPIRVPCHQRATSLLGLCDEHAEELVP